MEYFYKRLGRYVRVVQMFDSHWNYYDTTDGTQTIRHGLPEDFSQEKSVTPVIVIAPPAPPASPASPVPSEIPVVPKTPTPGFIKTINLNTEKSPAVIALHLPGIGKTWAKKICDRRPKDGYKDFDHFSDVNKDFGLDDAAWGKVKELVEF